MARGVRVERTYTGKALKIHEKIQRLEDDLKNAREELKKAYKEQLATEKAQMKKVSKEEKDKLLKAFKDSGKSVDELIDLLTK